MNSPLTGAQLSKLKSNPQTSHPSSGRSLIVWELAWVPGRLTWALVLVSFSTLSCIISAALAMHILWQHMSCLHPLLLAVLTMILLQKATSRRGIFPKSFPLPFTPAWFGCLKTTDPGSRFQKTQCFERKRSQCKHFPKPYLCWAPIGWRCLLQLPSLQDLTKTEAETSPCPRTRFQRCRWSLIHPHTKLKSKLLAPKKEMGGGKGVREGGEGSWNSLQIITFPWQQASKAGEMGRGVRRGREAER